VKENEIEDSKEKIQIFEPTCCSTASDSCCNSSKDKVITQNNTEFQPLEIAYDPDKLHVDIYVPMDACACEWSQFMNLIFSAITPYINYIKHETKSLNSDEARKIGLFNKCVIVDGKKKYTTSFALKQDLPKLLEEKGLL
jgi:hypothetical protein